MNIKVNINKPIPAFFRVLFILNENKLMDECRDERVIDDIEEKNKQKNKHVV